ncbi:MAG: hypothetical protein IT480_19310 [Gammaproteobacteria bacterium]|nr:hypothetical protein [Gammaproteobacteria bacterium]
MVTEASWKPTTTSFIRIGSLATHDGPDGVSNPAANFGNTPVELLESRHFVAPPAAVRRRPSRALPCGRRHRATLSGFAGRFAPGRYIAVAVEVSGPIRLSNALRRAL